ncbi:MAG: TrkH family potassium uptake protein [Gammaproteobacteria bacterium]
MMLLRPVLFVQAFVLLILAVMTVPPALIAEWDNSATLRTFLGTGCACLVLAVPAFRAKGKEPLWLSSRQMYLVTTVSWCVVSVVGAIPLYAALPGTTFTDALFESVSGVTTTGSTVLSGLDTMAQSILLWRALLQWLGGIGIIVLAIAVLPYLRIGGMRLFKTESSDWSEKRLPRTQNLIWAIGVVYLGLSCITALSYWLAGMGSFDAIVHSMTTVATGGYANYDASLGHFDNPIILWLSSLFMLLSALPFLLYVSLLHGQVTPLVTDRQVRGFLLFVVVVTVVLSLQRSLVEHESILDALTHTTFNVISVITTTGYASEDYLTWGNFAVTVFFYLTFIGGCSGSTAGGIKIFRFQIGLMMLRNQMRQMRHVQGVFTNFYNDRYITDDILRSVIAFSFYFTLTVAVLALSLSMCGLDFVTSLSAAATAVGNVGPGLGDIVGPAGNFSSLPDAAKWSLTLGMLLGRLEIMTVLILFTPTFWRT